MSNLTNRWICSHGPEARERENRDRYNLVELSTSPYERGRPSGIKGARRLRLDPDKVEVSELSGAGSTETAWRVRVEGRALSSRGYFRLEPVS